MTNAPTDPTATDELRSMEYGDGAMHEDGGNGMQSMAEEGMRQGRGRLANAANKASKFLGNTADYVREHDGADIMRDVQRMAKRQPGTTLLLAAVAGFLLGRAATSRHRS
jgi:hypothetical protein